MINELLSDGMRTNTPTTYENRQRESDQSNLNNNDNNHNNHHSNHSTLREEQFHILETIARQLTQINQLFYQNAELYSQLQGGTGLLNALASLQLYNSSMNNLTSAMKLLIEQDIAFGRSRRQQPLRPTNRPNSHLFDLYFEIPMAEYLEELGGSTRQTLTIEQIQQCVETKVYDSLFNETSCPISMENFVVGENILQIKRCKHIFKHQPLSRWLQNNSTCPLCRQNILETSHNQRPTPNALDQMRQNTQGSAWTRSLRRESPLRNTNSILRNSIQRILENFISPPSQGTTFAQERDEETGVHNGMEEVD